MVTINGLAEMLMKIAGKKLTLQHVPGPVGVRGRNSNNTLIQEKLGWRPTEPLIAGLRKLYPWILARVQAARQWAPAKHQAESSD
jgi:nucleoside-diphosphate-sugar epimerase